MTELTLDHVNAFFGLALFDADPRFVRVLSANLDAGEGTYQARGETTPQPFMFDEAGKLLAPVHCAEARAELRAASAPPTKPYAEAFTRLRAAQGITPPTPVTVEASLTPPRPYTIAMKGTK